MSRMIPGGPLVSMSDEAWWRRPAALRYAYSEQDHGLVHYRIVTPDQAVYPPLIMSHQSGSSGRCYEHLAAALGRDRIVIVVDTPGFGASDPLPAAPFIEDFAVVVETLVAELGFDQIDVFGDHTGSSTSVELANRNPKLVRRVVMHAAPIFTEEELAVLRARDAKIEAPDESGDHIMMRWTWRRENMACAPVVLREMEMVEALRSGPFAGHGHHAALHYDLRGSLAKVDQPVCLLRLRDYYEATGRGGPLIRNGEMIDLPDFGRESLTLRHVQLAQIIGEFLGRP